jgi:hypothetical protein
MASLLVPVADMEAFLGDIDTADASLVASLTALIDDVENTFLRECGRPDRPFGAADAARVETRDGTGCDTLYLQRDVVSLTSVLLGFDYTDPDETLDPTALDELNWRTGSARVQRLDGAFFGWAGQPNYIRVTYSAAADLPRDAAIAIQRVVAAVWRKRGSEDVSSERIGPYDNAYLAAADAEPLWQMAVRHHKEIHV